jgi:hypothetical protein
MSINYTTDQVTKENAAYKLEVQEDNTRREEYLSTLPAFIAGEVKNFVDELSDDTLRVAISSSNDEHVQYEFQAELPRGEIRDHKEQVRVYNANESNWTPAQRLAINLANYDAAHIASLKHPQRSGGGIDQYLREGLFSTCNLDQINRDICDEIQKVLRTRKYCSILFSRDWGSPRFSLTITMTPKRQSA